jgi:hypothetical protein
MLVLHRIAQKLPSMLGTHKNFNNKQSKTIIHFHQKGEPYCMDDVTTTTHVCQILNPLLVAPLLAATSSPGWADQIGPS